MTYRFNQWLPIVLPGVLLAFVLLFPEQAHATYLVRTLLPGDHDLLM